MNLPGFTAERSVDEMRGNYQLAAEHLDLGEAVVPAFCLEHCLACGIGHGAWHCAMCAVCMIFT